VRVNGGPTPAPAASLAAGGTSSPRVDQGFADGGGAAVS
jgi:hypothetical protein